MRSFLAFICSYSAVATSPAESLCGKETTANDVVGDARTQSGLVAIVTGGDSGLGYAIAESMAQGGAKVVIASRNFLKTKSAARNITALTGGDVVPMPLDLSSFKSVEDFAATFLKKFSVLNYLFNNAGMFGGGTPQATDDDYESVFEVDYLGHFLLTELLLPALRKNMGRKPAKIINTASWVHKFACPGVGLQNDCLKDWSSIPPRVGDMAKPIGAMATTWHLTEPMTYGIAKFLQIQHAAELAKRERSNHIEAFSVCPGYVLTGMTDEGQSDAEWKRECESTGQGVLQSPCPYTPQQGAAVLATSALIATHNGAWYTRVKGCTDSMTVSMQGFTHEMQSELYERSLKWVGLDAVGLWQRHIPSLATRASISHCLGATLAGAMVAMIAAISCRVRRRNASQRSEVALEPLTGLD